MKPFQQSLDQSLPFYNIHLNVRIEKNMAPKAKSLVALNLFLMPTNDFN